jgi:hypothetical protein
MAECQIFLLSNTGNFELKAIKYTPTQPIDTSHGFSDLAGSDRKGLIGEVKECKKK